MATAALHSDGRLSRAMRKTGGGVSCAPTVSAAANSVGVVPILTTAILAPAKSNAVAALPPPPRGGWPHRHRLQGHLQPDAHAPRDDSSRPARGFYTYDAFIEAAKSFPAFGSTGDVETLKKEIAPFFGQTSHQTSGGWPTTPDGPYAWGYCFNKEAQPSSSFCDMSFRQFPCVPGNQYYGRRPFQITWNFNYGPCGKAIGVDLLNNPDLVATDAVISFKTALWFWMTAPG